MASLKVQSPNTTYTEEHIESKYNYETTRMEYEDGNWIATPEKMEYIFKLLRKVSKP